MPKTYGVKDRDLAAARVMEWIFDGTLRPGDRLQRQQLADDLGISRVPVQEMLAQLELDGIVRSEYHRGAYVDRFDAETLRETYDMYALITGLAAAKSAKLITAELAAHLRALVDEMADVDQDRFYDVTWEYRRTVNRLASGPRVRAMLLTFRTFMPTAYSILIEQHRARIRDHYLSEVTALARRDGAGARKAIEARCADEAELLITELRRRGVLDAAAP